MARPKKVVPAPPPSLTIGARIDQLHAMRESKRLLEAEVKKLKDAADALELELIQLMDKEKVSKSTGSQASVSLTTAIKPSVVDWDEFYAYIYKNKFGHLLERRPAVLGCRELFEAKGKIPGVVPFTQRTLLLRSI